MIRYLLGMLMFVAMFVFVSFAIPLLFVFSALDTVLGINRHEPFSEFMGYEGER